jgi:hypothetical protein
MTLLLLGSGAGVGGGGAVTDPNFSSVKLLMGFEGANGSQTSPGMDDQSSAAHGTATTHGLTAAISTAQAKFGSSSVVLTGTGNQDLIRFADSADWHLGSGNFTIECFIRPVSLSGSQFLITQWGSTNLSWALWLSGDQLSWNVSTNGSDNNFDMTSPSSLLTTGAWHHVCVDYNGTKYRMYINGAMVASSTTARTIFTGTSNLSIGGNFETLQFFYNGYIDELRVTKGVARYASDAGFTVPTGAFPRS